MDVRTLPPDALGRVVSFFARTLADFQDEINGLNVYPVPDGDTGSNLRLTFESVRKALETAGEDVCGTIVRASLMGARGNSGVITSQIVRGLADAVSASNGLTADALRKGLRAASDLAYSAVMQPQEGTILTVVREAAEEAEARADLPLTDLARAVLVRARDALARTPELLPVLKQAGVVDAGGRGLVLLLECLLNDLDSTPLPEPKVTSGVRSATAAEDGDTLRYPFEVQFLFEVTDDKAEAYRQMLDAVGDCVLVVGHDGLYNVHVHTDQIGTVIERAIEIGRPRDIDVQYLQGQVDERRELEPVGVATVAVGAGDGMLEIFRSLGVRGLVPGGQTFNPSAAEILDGIRQAKADEVIVLPNNRNVIGSARTAAQVAVDEGIVKQAEVVPTESPLQAFAALFAFDGAASAAVNAISMTAASARTRHGEIAYAVRDAETPAGHVDAGQCLGLVEGKVAVVAHSLRDAVMQVVRMLTSGGESLVTLVYGADVSEWDAHEFGRAIETEFGLEVEVQRGGQPHYPFLVGAE